MSQTQTITLIDGVRIVVPNSLDMITPYVLLEQQDWFEEEIKFLRCWLQPGQKAIDIGANYGVYTLPIARVVGSEGCVWAFEPASSTAKLLNEGIVTNNFSQIVLDRRALSDTCGTGQLSLNENSELNALIREQPLLNPSETVSLVTLDLCLESYAWRDIDFVKIDAEGEEANILKGGAQFFQKLSPLVQYEIKAGNALHLQLVQDFAALGYKSYRLVPGLNLLVSFQTESKPDEALLNLFCCKSDRARRLAEAGFLVDYPVPKRELDEVAEKVKNSKAYNWRYTIAKLPYGVRLATLWEQTMATGSHAEIEEALSFYALSRDSSVSPLDRFAALEVSFNQFSRLCARQPTSLRLASLARVAREYGARSLAANALRQLSTIIFQHNWVDLSEPFLPPGERFDSISPGEAIGDWVLASVLEEFERLSSFSSFYTGLSARQRLETIRILGFGSGEMERRLHLLQQRFGLSSS